MSKLPSMPFLVDRYLGDTTHLTLEEHGAYMLLLFAMWKRAGAIAAGDAARLLGITPRLWLRIKPRLMPMLISYQSEGVEMLTQKRLQEQWNYAVENSRKQSVKGKAGFEARKRNQNERNQILGPSRGLSPSITRAQARDHASISNKKDNRIDQNYTGLSASEGAEHEEEADDSGPAARPGLAMLLKTPLMRRVR